MVTVQTAVWTPSKFELSYLRKRLLFNKASGTNFGGVAIVEAAAKSGDACAGEKSRANADVPHHEPAVSCLQSCHALLVYTPGPTDPTEACLQSPHTLAHLRPEFQTLNTLHQTRSLITEDWPSLARKQN